MRLLWAVLAEFAIAARWPVKVLLWTVGLLLAAWSIAGPVLEWLEML